MMQSLVILTLFQDNIKLETGKKSRRKVKFILDKGPPEQDVAINETWVAHFSAEKDIFQVASLTPADVRTSLTPLRAQ